ncbi:hypothetical protein [Tautonia marina]|uniref:hypothetical protein n=1 Tax=Tautonia marina TaxID=2653855 RepID=UPI001375C025|nr:hypothetical protein [Tautonia marina]
MSKVHTLDTPASYAYEDEDCIVRVTDKAGEPLTNAVAFYALCKAAIDLLIDYGDEAED